jgi:hypothetical protein
VISSNFGESECYLSSMPGESEYAFIFSIFSFFKCSCKIQISIPSYFACENMNAFDREFWNGALKASIMIEKDLRKLFNEADTGKKEGIKVALVRVKEMKDSIETLHGNSVLKALREIDLEDQV